VLLSPHIASGKEKLVPKSSLFSMAGGREFADRDLNGSSRILFCFKGL